LPFDTLDALRATLYDRLPHLALVDEVTPADPASLAELAGAGGALGHGAFRSPIKDYYFTNPIARASRIMAECSKLRRERRLEAAE
jgi:NADH-quinone oxidoreductase subunit G